MHCMTADMTDGRQQQKKKRNKNKQRRQKQQGDNKSSLVPFVCPSASCFTELPNRSMLKQNAPVQTLLPTLPSQTSTSLPASTNLLLSWEVRFATIWWAPHLRQASLPTWRPRVNCVRVQPACCVLGVCVPGLTDLCLCKEFACIKPEVYTSVLMSATQYMKGTYCPCDMTWSCRNSSGRNFLHCLNQGDLIRNLQNKAQSSQAHSKAKGQCCTICAMVLLGLKVVLCAALLMSLLRGT